MPTSGSLQLSEPVSLEPQALVSVKLKSRHTFRRGHVKKQFESSFLIECARASGNLRDVARQQETWQDSLTAAVGSSEADNFLMAASASGFQWPGKDVVRLSRIRLDC